VRVVILSWPVDNFSGRTGYYGLQQGLTTGRCGNGPSGIERNVLFAPGECVKTQTGAQADDSVFSRSVNHLEVLWTDQDYGINPRGIDSKLPVCL